MNFKISAEYRNVVNLLEKRRSRNFERATFEVFAVYINYGSFTLLDKQQYLKTLKNVIAKYPKLTEKSNNLMEDKYSILSNEEYADFVKFALAQNKNCIEIIDHNRLILDVNLYYEIMENMIKIEHTNLLSKSFYGETFLEFIKIKNDTQGQYLDIVHQAIRNMKNESLMEKDKYRENQEINVCKYYDNIGNIFCCILENEELSVLSDDKYLELVNLLITSAKEFEDNILLEECRRGVISGYNPLDLSSIEKIINGANDRDFLDNDLYYNLISRLIEIPKEDNFDRDARCYYYDNGENEDNSDYILDEMDFIKSIRPELLCLFLETDNPIEEDYIKHFEKCSDLYYELMLSLENQNIHVGRYLDHGFLNYDQREAFKFTPNLDHVVNYIGSDMNYDSNSEISD